MSAIEPTPELSVVLATPGPYTLIADVLASLRRQTAVARMEIVVATAHGGWVDAVPPEQGGVGALRIVHVAGSPTPGGLRAAGVRASSAPVVAMCEDHVLHDEGWAEALIARHREPWAAVGPAFYNANPQSSVSWADFVIAYGPWLEPVEGGRVSLLAGHNSSYKREPLVAYGHRLDHLLDAETVLFWDLDAHGLRLYLEPRARVGHVNFSRLGLWLRVQYHAGRVFAADRARFGRWSPIRRAAYAVGSPLIPFVRFARCVGHARRVPHAPLRLFGPLVAGLVADAGGQLVGYATGAGTSPAAFAWHEFDRVGLNAGRRRR